MIVDCHISLDYGTVKVILDKVSESSMVVLFLFSLTLQNQKLIERIKNPVKSGKNIIANGALFDYVD